MEIDVLLQALQVDAHQAPREQASLQRRVGDGLLKKQRRDRVRLRLPVHARVRRALLESIVHHLRKVLGQSLHSPAKAQVTDQYAAEFPHEGAERSWRGR